MRCLLRLLIFFLFLIPIGGRSVCAQSRSEIAFSLGTGSLQVSPGGGTTGVSSLSYWFHITRHISAEGALDEFNYNFPTGPANSIDKDDYLGAEAALVCDFSSRRETGRVLPLVAVGIGKTTTDFTEIAAHPYYRLGAGISYYLTDRFGIRLEARDEIVTKLANEGSPPGHLPSVRSESLTGVSSRQRLRSGARSVQVEGSG